MSSIANLTSTPALAQLNTHLHGHKKGSHVASAADSDSSSKPPRQCRGTQKNLFGSLLQSLEQVIGVPIECCGTRRRDECRRRAGHCRCGSVPARQQPADRRIQVNVVA